MPTVPDDVLELIKPALQKRIEELIDSAFKLARFGECLDILENAIDTCSSKYFEACGQDSSTSHPDWVTEPGVPDNGPASTTQSTKKYPTRMGQNIVVGAPSPQIDPGKKAASQTNSKNLVKANRYTKLGRPLSRYAGVSYSGSLSNPWLVRFHEKRVGMFADEISAARAYDLARIRAGETPINFEMSVYRRPVT